MCHHTYTVRYNADLSKQLPRIHKLNAAKWDQTSSSVVMMERHGKSDLHYSTKEPVRLEDFTQSELLRHGLAKGFCVLV